MRLEQHAGCRKMPPGGASGPDRQAIDPSVMPLSVEDFEPPRYKILRASGCPRSELESGPGESHPRALAEPYVTVSRHTAPTGRLWVSGSSHQWAKSPGWRCRAAISQ